MRVWLCCSLVFLATAASAAEPDRSNTFTSAFARGSTGRDGARTRRGDEGAAGRNAIGVTVIASGPSQNFEDFFDCIAVSHLIFRTRWPFAARTAFVCAQVCSPLISEAKHRG